jgi:hypothetical protein
MKPSDFPSLENASKASTSTGYQMAAFALALNWLDEGVQAGEIRNVYLDSCKHRLGRLVSNAWDVVSKKIDKSDTRTWPDPLKKLFDNLYISGLHDVIVANNRLQKSKATGPQVDVLRAFVTEVLPLAQVAADLKSKVVKGREPSKGPSKPVNPNKIVRQCACCFRDIAVGTDGTMVHHGYERPGSGSQTSSCWGIDYEPLEVSTKGLEYVISNLDERLAREQAYRTSLDTATSISIIRGFQIDKYNKGDKGFDWELRNEKSRVDHLIIRIQDQLLVANYVLDHWTPGRPQVIPIALELKRQKEDQEEGPSGPKF